MQIPRDACTFADPLLHSQSEVTRDLAQSKPIEHRQHSDGRHQARRLKPPCLIVCRSDSEIQPCARLTPNATSAGADAEAVVAGRKVVVEYLPSSACVGPLMISPLQHVAEANFFRRRCVNGGIFDLQI